MNINGPNNDENITEDGKVRYEMEGTIVEDKNIDAKTLEKYFVSVI